MSWLTAVNHSEVPVQGDSARIQDILASLLYSGRKWRRVVHLYIQSMITSLHDGKIYENKCTLENNYNSFSTVQITASPASGTQQAEISF